MNRPQRLASSLLFAAGLVLLLSRSSAALGFVPPGVVASIAATVAFLLALLLWVGTPSFLSPPCVIVFDSALRISGGPLAGKPLLSQFPLVMRSEVERRCHAAIRGEHSRFTCTDGLRSRTFDAAPVLSGQRSVICGVLIEGAAIPAPSMLGERALGTIG